MFPQCSPTCGNNSLEHLAFGLLSSTSWSFQPFQISRLILYHLYLQSIVFLDQPFHISSLINNQLFHLSYLILSWLTSSGMCPSWAASSRQRTNQTAAAIACWFEHFQRFSKNRIELKSHFDGGDGVSLNDVGVDVGDVVLHDVLVDPVERIKESSNHSTIAVVNSKLKH